MLRPLIIAVALLFSTTATRAQSERDWKLCNGDDDKAAIPACTRLIDTGKLSRKDFAVAYYNRGLSNRRLAANDKALADYNKAMEYDPKDSEIFNNRGVVYEAMGELDKALSDYNKAIEFDAKNDVAYSNRGDIFWKRSDFTKAEVDYNKAISLNPKKATHHTDLAVTFATTGRYDRAITSATRAIGLDDKSDQAHSVRGFAHYFMADYAKAAADFRRAVDLETSAPAMIYRFLARARTGATSTAELEADATRLKSKEWPYAAIEMFLAKRTPDATLSVADTPSQKCEAHYYTAHWHLQRGNQAAHVASLKSAADLCPKNDYEHMGARAELKRLGQ